jgi:two-component system, OmpR family, sensor histidine kinase KdpD
VAYVSGTFIPIRSPIRSAIAWRAVHGPGWRVPRFALQSALGVAGTILVAALARRYAFQLPAAALLSLAIVVPMALFFGFWQAAIVSFSAVATGSLLKPQQPVLQAAVHPVDIAILAVLMLAALLLAALVASRLSAEAAIRKRQAEASDSQMRNLCELTRRTLEMNLHIEPGPQLAELVHEIFSLEAVVIFDADLHESYQAGYWSQDPQEMARIVYYFETCDDDAATGLARRVLRLGRVPIGSLVLRGDTSPLTNNAIAALIATTFDRYRALANEGQIETERRTEQLRATVLDSLAHAYKTPLTAIRAASTGLSEMGKLSATQADLVALIDEQAGVLNDLTTRLLTTARMDAGEVEVRAEPLRARELIDEVVSALRDRLASMKLSIQLEDEALELNCDRRLMVALLTQYIDNACKYSIYGTTITVGAARSRAEIVFSVHSSGPEIPVDERERIFDRYYRSSASSQGAAGTGIGLAVAKRAAQMHGGHVWVSSDELKGTTFFAAIPDAVLQRSST